MAQRKPLDLLKLLLAHVEGVEITRLMDLMWPDSEADSARNALDLALHRLRRMLKTTQAVLLIDGRILLSREVVWSDVFALECLIDKPISPQELPEAVERLLELYRAPLLSAEDDTAVIAVARDSLRSQFLRTAEDLAGRLAARGEWELLSSLCRRAIEKEPLEESLHRELVRALLARGQRDQAQLAYRRCERIVTQALASTRHV